MLGTLKTVVFRAILGLNIALVVLMIAAGYSDYVSPARLSVAVLMGLSFPVFVAIDVAFVVVWLLFRVRYALVPIVGLLLVYPPVRCYYPYNRVVEPSDSAITLVTYNVWNFNSIHRGDEQSDIVDYLSSCGADIVCLQEAGCSPWRRNWIHERLVRVYPHSATALSANYNDEIALYTRFPVVGTEDIAYGSRTNKSAAFMLLIGGDTVVLVANHFESIGLSDDEKQALRNVVEGTDSAESARPSARLLLGKVSEAAAVRAPQAEAVADYIASVRSRGLSVIVCGDFNEGPVSYVRRTVARSLVDCYVAGGRGFGFTYKKGGIWVRIDHVMCSDEWRPCSAAVYYGIDASDHFPLVCTMEKRSKESK